MNRKSKNGNMRGISQYHKKWLVKVRKKYVGIFPTVEEAREAWLKAAREIYGEDLITPL